MNADAETINEVKPAGADRGIWRWYVQRLADCWQGTGITSEPNLCDMIAQCNGWLPLEVGQKMSVGFWGKRYKIVREE